MATSTRADQDELALIAGYVAGALMRVFGADEDYGVKVDSIEVDENGDYTRRVILAHPSGNRYAISVDFECNPKDDVVELRRELADDVVELRKELAAGE